jgi:hypothetical protein
MITPSHIIYSWALARKTEKTGDIGQKRTVAFLLGAVFPDTPTYVFFLVCGINQQPRGRATGVYPSRMS